MSPSPNAARGAAARSLPRTASTMPRLTQYAFALLLCGIAAAQHGSQQSDDPRAPMYVAPPSDEAHAALKTMQLADGLVADLIAAEPDVCNAVALSIDGKGRIYVCETFRIGDGTFDNRSYMQWKDADLACRTVADRVAKYKRYLPDEYQRLSSFGERVRMLADTDRNGSFDRVTLFAEGMNELADGIIAGVLPVDDRVFVTNIPKLLAFRDHDDDGVADERQVLHDGFGVHTSLIGHDMHGLIVGPDQRLYFSIGDRGFRVEREDGVLDHPDEGAVLRCELDGSDLEVVHRGLRNPQELAFDQWGDLFTGDNNSDGGDRARLVQIVPGADSGWRIGYQWLDDRGAWMRERMWHARHPQQTAALLPPIQNFADGPSGLVYDLGHGLPERFRDCFLLCDFRGGSSYSGIRTFRLSRRGAGYEVAQSDKLAWNVLATDCDFGPDGALYVTDWVNGWGKTGKGRIYRLRTRQMANDFKLRNTARLLGSDLSQRPASQLEALLAHVDRRVRQKAQFALVGQQAIDTLSAATSQRASRLARLHGIWGLGTLLRRADGPAKQLLQLLGDEDGDVRAMAARALGDARHQPAEAALRKLLTDDNSRVKREAALALARLTSHADTTVTALIAMLRHNDDRDCVLRHAGVHALTACASETVLAAHRDDESLAVQRAVLLAMARQGSPAIAHFLGHRSEQLRFEAARAIYETPIPAAMQEPRRTQLRRPSATATASSGGPSTPTACIGEVENGEALVHAAYSAINSAAMREEALAVLAEWIEPHGQCRVTGNWRPCEHPSAEIVAQNFRGSGARLLSDPVTAAAAAHTAAKLRRTKLAPELLTLVADGDMPVAARVAGLDALDELPTARTAAGAGARRCRSAGRTAQARDRAAVAHGAGRRPSRYLRRCSTTHLSANARRRSKHWATCSTSTPPACWIAGCNTTRVARLPPPFSSTCSRLPPSTRRWRRAPAKIDADMQAGGPARALPGLRRWRRRGSGPQGVLRVRSHALHALPHPGRRRRQRRPAAR